MSARSTLEKARAFLDDPKHWTKHQLFTDRKGIPVTRTSQHLKCACSVGAILIAAGGTQDPDYDDARDELQRIIAPRNVVEWNDSASTTHADVLGAFDSAIAACEP